MTGHMNDDIVIVFRKSQKMTYFKHDIDTETPNGATDFVRCSRMYTLRHSKISLPVQIFTRFHCHPLLHKNKINFSIKGNLRHSLNGLIIL